MKTYLVTYSWPIKYRGSYMAYGYDSIDAGNKVSQYLKETFGPTNDSMSIVTEIIGNNIKIIGYGEI